MHNEVATFFVDQDCQIVSKAKAAMACKEGVLKKRGKEGEMNREREKYIKPERLALRL